jgi:tetratricopeptide (TPR) repeat protein
VIIEESADNNSSAESINIFRDKIVSKHSWLFLLLACVSLWSGGQAVQAQALLPYSPELNTEQLEQAGLEMAEEAIQLMRFDRSDAAVSRAELSTQLAPERFQTWFILGSLYLQGQQIDRGIEALRQAQSLAPEEAVIRFTLGSAYFEKGDYQTAIDEIDEGLKLKADVPTAYFDLGNSHLKLGQYNKAIDAYRKAVSLEKNFWPAINNMGLVRYEQGDLPGALKEWQASIAIDQEQAEPRLALAVATYVQGKKADALKMGEAALTIDRRYSDLEFLRKNLWGDKLLADTRMFLETPEMKAVLARLPAQPTLEEQ